MPTILPSRSSLKARWQKLPEEFFETLSFGELELGEEFICLPGPGDNDGHGGFKATGWVFTKTKNSVTKTCRLRYGIPHGEARRRMDGQLSDFPCSMDVLRIR